MPVISFDIGELTKEQKEILAKEFSESASRVTGLPIEMIYVLFNERKFDNVGVSGIDGFLKIHSFHFKSNISLYISFNSFFSYSE